MIAAGRARSPGDWFLAFLWAESARRRGDLIGAIGRWRRVRKDFPDAVEGFLEGAKCLIQAERLDKADALFRKAIRRFPDMQGLAFRWAALAERRQDWPQALARWQGAAERFPRALEALMGTVRVLCQLHASTKPKRCCWQTNGFRLQTRAVDRICNSRAA